jgi:hypothetical protein
MGFKEMTPLGSGFTNLQGRLRRLSFLYGSEIWPKPCSNTFRFIDNVSIDSRTTRYDRLGPNVRKNGRTLYRACKP